MLGIRVLWRFLLPYRGARILADINRVIRVMKLETPVYGEIPFMRHIPKTHHC